MAYSLSIVSSKLIKKPPFHQLSKGCNVELNSTGQTFHGKLKMTGTLSSIFVLTCCLHNKVIHNDKKMVAI